MNVSASEQIRHQYDRLYFEGGVDAAGNVFGVGGWREFAQGGMAQSKRTNAEYIPYAGRHVLDAGCGRGEVMLHCLTHGALTAVGIDFAEPAVMMTAELMQRHSIPHSMWKVRNYALHGLWKLPASFGSNFGAVYLCDVVEHVPDWEIFAFNAQLQDRLAPDANIAVVTPAPPYCGEYRDMHCNYQTKHSLRRLFAPFWRHIVIEQIGGTVQYNEQQGGDLVLKGSEPIRCQP